MGNTCSNEISCDFNFTKGAVVEFDEDPDIVTSLSPSGFSEAIISLITVRSGWYRSKRSLLRNACGLVARRIRIQTDLLKSPPNQVIVSFLISAWATFLLALFAYLFVEGVLNEDDMFVTTFDLQVLKLAEKLKDVCKKAVKALAGNWLRRLFLALWPTHQRRFTKEQMQQVGLMAADQQLIAGAAILIVGYSRHCEITQYHFFIASLMTLCSFATFQAIVILVRDALDSHFKRFWRIVWITVICGCVMANNFVVYNDYFLVLGHFGHSMDCVWDAISLGQEYDRRQAAYVSLGMLVDAWSYLSIVAYLNPTLLEWRPVAFIIFAPWFVLRQVSEAYLLVRSLRQQHYSKNGILTILESLAFCLFVIAFAIRELFFSLFIDLLRIFLYLFQITVDLAKWRNLAGENGRKETENEWGFGQLLPMLLLALPLFAFLEIVYPARKLGDNAEAATVSQTGLHARSATNDAANNGAIHESSSTTKPSSLIHLSFHQEQTTAAQPLSLQPPTTRTTHFDAIREAEWWHHDFSYGGVEDLEASMYATKWFRSWLSFLARGVLLSRLAASRVILGLHLEPPSDIPRGDREIRKRLWWAVWVLDAKSSVKLGRPFVVDSSQVTVSLPSDDFEVASYNSAALGSVAPSLTWLTYFLEHAKLFGTMVDIYKSFYVKSGHLLSQNRLACIYTDPHVLEASAKDLVARIPAMKSWVEDLPTQMKMPRRSGAEPFSTDRSGVEIDGFSPTWLQRQRVYLELTYHSMLVSLTRPFITFYSHSHTYAPVTERQANICIDHAITFTFIMHQVNTESDNLSGWTEFFIHQWSIAITIVGFILANPIHQAAPKARQALDKAIETFHLLGVHFSVSADAARIMRDLVGKVDTLAGGDQSSGLVGGSGLDTGQITLDSFGVPQSIDSLAWLDPSRLNETGSINEVMDWALSIDSFNNFENFFNP
ncbi:Transcription factor asqA [Paramyrothecium foliicola]|nr:Transcription factor asqA [Paramyrothecium foliicola]